MEKGIITITLENATLPETERCRQIIHKLFEKGVFNIRNGKAILNFDEMGLLAEIEGQIKLWKRGKEAIEVKEIEQFRVELDPSNLSTVARKV